MGWQPGDPAARFRNGHVLAVAGGTCTLSMDGGTYQQVPVHGPAAAGDRVLVLVQDAGMLVLGDGYLPLAGGTVSGDIAVGGRGITYPGATYPGGGSNRVGFRWASPNIIGVIDNVASAVVGTVSTGRLKGDVRAVVGALAAVARLRPVQYTPLELDGTAAQGAGTHLGLIAEEVADVVPSAVLVADDGTPASVNYLELVPLLVAAVQELAARVAALEGGSDG